ncbi:hypothetical protein NKG94_43360 [Micromonospora sp. M12]
MHVLVPAARRAARTTLRRLPLDMPAVLVHRTSVLPESHCQLARPPRTTTARALVDAAGWAGSVDEAQAVLAAGCQQRRVLPEELRAVLDVLPRAPRRQLIGQTISDIEGGAQALSEIDFLRLCRQHRLPAPTCKNIGSTWPAGTAGWTRTGGSGGCRWRSTARTTWRPSSGRPTCAGRTTSGPAAIEFCAFRPGWSAPAPTRSPKRSDAP